MADSTPADSSQKTNAWLGTALAFVGALLAIGSIVANQSAGQARVEQDLKDLRQDVAELKNDVKALRGMRAVYNGPTIENAPVRVIPAVVKAPVYGRPFELRNL